MNKSDCGRLSAALLETALNSGVILPGKDRLYLHFAKEGKIHN